MAEITYSPSGKWIWCDDPAYLLTWLEENMERSASEYIPLAHDQSVGWCVYKDKNGHLWKVTFRNKRIDREVGVKPKRYAVRLVKKVETPIIHVDYLEA